MSKAEFVTIMTVVWSILISLIVLLITGNTLPMIVTLIGGIIVLLYWFTKAGLELLKE